MAVHEARVHRVGHEVDLLRLPRPQPFEKPFELLGRRRHLFGERRRIAREIERLEGQYGGRLVIAVVLAGHLHRHPREDHLGPREADEPHGFGKHAAVPPVRQRPHGILSRGVVAAQEPDVGDSERGQSATRLDLPNRAEAAGTLGPVLVAA